MDLYNEHFTISNIPFGVVSTSEEPKHQIATRLHGDVFIIPKLVEKELLGELEPAVHAALLEPTLNTFASLGRPVHRHIRQKLQSLLRSWPSSTSKPKSNGNTTSQTNGDLSSCHGPTIDHLRSCSHPITSVTTHLPIHPRDFSDFSCSKDHVLNAGEAVLGKRELPPGFPHFPVGYAGRCSSIVPSGTSIRRPRGQFRSKTKEGGMEVVFEPSRAVDFELEVACVIGKGSEMGRPVRIEDADEHIFGLVLLNDWSARDIQGLEMNPLGPFNGKSFGTTISPWIVLIDALIPFECAAPPKDNAPANYLNDTKKDSTYAINLQVKLDTSSNSTVACTSHFQSLYWTLRDMIAHQTIGGCPLTPGDFLATGTISESQKGTHGCLLEATKGGKEILELSDGSTRTYLMDGDKIALSGWAGEVGSEECVGFGECAGVLEPALA